MFRLIDRDFLRFTWRRFAIAVTVAVAIALVVLHVMTVDRDTRVAVQIAKLQSDLVIAQTDLVRQDASMLERIAQLERAVFGATPPPPVVVDTGPQLWQRNRDREIQNRLRALEQWRMRVQQPQ